MSETAQSNECFPSAPGVLHAKKGNPPIWGVKVDTFPFPPESERGEREGVWFGVLFWVCSEFRGEAGGYRDIYVLAQDLNSEAGI